MENMMFGDDSSEEEEDIAALVTVKKKTYRKRINFFQFHADEFVQRFRLRPSEAEFVLGFIGGHLKHKTDKNFALSPQQQLLITLHWFVPGTTQIGISDMHGVGKATVGRAIKRVVALIVNQMSQKFIRWPEDCSGIPLEFSRKGGFPSVCGAVDGTIINLIAPSKFEEQYVDRHGKHSLNAMVISGPHYKFYYVNARFPGSVHDSRVLVQSASRIYEKFNSGWRPFPGCVLLGDSGYGLKSWLIPPLRQDPGDPQEQRFNVAHKRTRRIVENSIGILKNRFMVLKYLRVSPEFVGQVVLACATLHNIACNCDFMIETDNEESANADENVNNEIPSDNVRAKLAELLSFF